MGTIRTSGRRTRHRFTLALVPVSLLVLAPLQAATPIRFAGAVSGLVMDSAGKPKPGAAVALYNQQERLLQKTYTDLAGNFSFGDLLPDFYAVQVSLASFVPTSRDRVQVRSGMRSLLEVSLSKVFSSIQVVSTVPAPWGLMSYDWKRTLRADSSQRPILRILPSAPGTKSASTTSGTTKTTIAGNSKTAIFHDSTALVKISATDSALSDAAGGRGRPRHAVRLRHLGLFHQSGSGERQSRLRVRLRSACHGDPHHLQSSGRRRYPVGLRDDAPDECAGPGCSGPARRSGSAKAPCPRCAPFRSAWPTRFS